jgi:hypothetical protein
VGRATVGCPPKMETERLVVRRKEWAARSTGQPAFSIACTVCSPARAGSVSGSAVGPSGPGARTGSVSPRVVLDSEGVVEREGIPREAVGERDETLHAKEIYVRPRDSYGKLRREVCGASALSS